jgi:hypothetical protein
MTEWEKVEDGPNGEVGFEGTIWKPEVVDEAITGDYVEKEEDVGLQGDSTLYHIKADDIYWKVWGSTVLDGLFKNVPVGSKVRLVYKGKRKSQKGNFYKFYELYTAKGGASASSSSNDGPETLDLSGRTSDEQAVNDIMKDGPDKQAAYWVGEITDYLIAEGIKADDIKPLIIGETASKWVRSGRIKTKTMLERIEKELKKRY